jgi:hypothetical protein
MVFLKKGSFQPKHNLVNNGLNEYDKFKLSGSVGLKPYATR